MLGVAADTVLPSAFLGDMEEVMEKPENWKTRQDRGEKWQRLHVEDDEGQ